MKTEEATEVAPVDVGQNQDVVQLRRMMTKFERLNGKAVSRIGYGGQFMWIVFGDEDFC